MIGNPTLERKVASKSITPVPFAREVFLGGANLLKTLEVLRAVFGANPPCAKEKEKENRSETRTDSWAICDFVRRSVIAVIQL